MHASKFLLIAVAAATAGCAYYASPVDSNFGSAVASARALQVANPSAGKPAVVSGMDGRSAKLAIDRYHGSFETPPAPVNVFNIGIGGSSGASSGAK